MELGLALPQLGEYSNHKTISAFAESADQIGYDALCVQEHFLYPERPRQSHIVDQLKLGADVVVPWPEAYKSVFSPLEILSFVAGITHNIRLQTSVLVFAYHRPVTLAKQCATIDQLSNGRMELGLGLGWAAEEYQHMDTPFSKKGARCSDFICALRAAWQQGPTQYNGPFYQFPLGETSPKPIQREGGNPSIPILGGFMSPQGYRRVIQYCDKWLPGGVPLSYVKTEAEKIRRIAEQEFNKAPPGIVMRFSAAPLLPGMSSIGVQQVDMTMKGKIDEMLPIIKEAKKAGISQVMIDVNYFNDLRGEDDWLLQPDFFKPLLEEAKA